MSNKRTVCLASFFCAFEFDKTPQKDVAEHNSSAEQFDFIQNIHQKRMHHIQNTQL